MLQKFLKNNAVLTTAPPPPTQKSHQKSRMTIPLEFSGSDTKKLTEAAYRKCRAAQARQTLSGLDHGDGAALGQPLEPGMTRLVINRLSALDLLMNKSSYPSKKKRTNLFKSEIVQLKRIKYEQEQPKTWWI